VGASWEGFALEQTLQIIKPPQAFYWATHGGAELDLFIPHLGHRYGIEFKFSETAKMSKSMQIAVEVLALDHLWIIHPGQHSYPIREKISACPLEEVFKLPDQMR
jgi:predicted AAA+ superfamily ATPase